MRRSPAAFALTCLSALTACGPLQDAEESPLWTGDDDVTLSSPLAALAASGPQSYTAQSQGYHDLLIHRTGFAWEGNVVGAGATARVYVVDKQSDTSGVVGTLRHALESTEPFWIRFDPSMAGKTITITSPIRAESHKTIDGRVNGAAPVRIKTSASDSNTVKGIIIDGKTQLIVFNLNFDDGYDQWKKQDTEGSEAIHVYGSDRIWLHQNRFARFRDVAVEFDEPKSDFVTMTYNLFEMQYQALVINATRADFHHNRCLNSGHRCPKVNAPDGGGANLYVYNNLIEFWRRAEVHFVEDPGQFLGEHNVYRPRTNALRESGQCGGMSDTWSHTENLMVGGVDEGGCLQSRSAHVESGSPAVTFNSFCIASPIVPAKVAIEPASDILAAQIRNHARPQGYTVDGACK